MSQWKMDVRRLYELGGCANTKLIDDGYGFDATDGLLRAQKLGLVKSSRQKRGGSGFSVWTITDLGRAWVENRVQQKLSCREGIKSHFVPTWLSSLPVGIRLNHVSVENRP